MAVVYGERIVLNISGNIFETHEKTLKRFPETLLGDSCKRKDYFCLSSRAYFFNRNRSSFEAILYFYQSNGDLRLPPSMKMESFVRECNFYEIPRQYIESMKFKAGIFTNKVDKETLKAADEARYIVPKTFRGKIWDFLENPETSKYARALAIFSLVTIFISVVLACLETLSSLQVPKDTPFWENTFSVCELTLNSWFLIEVTTRLIFAPSKIVFLTRFLNLVDIVGVVPYFIILLTNEGETTSLSFLRMLRFLRVLRLFRLSKHSARIKAVGAILKDSLQDLYIFVLCLLIMTVFSGAILYFAESKVPNSVFSSIPQSMWWALQTVVTLGYGDIVPVTLIGKIYAAFFMVFGALTIALPVLSIVMKFTSMYSMNEEEGVGEGEGGEGDGEDGGGGRAGGGGGA